MSVSRSTLTRGPAYLTYSSANFFSEHDLAIRREPAWERVTASMFGPVDAVKQNTVFKIAARMWGAWENLAILFPSYLLSPAAGASEFGTADTPLVIQARNNDKLTFANAQITKVANLRLGVEASLFAADVEWTALLANNTAPEAAGAYTTISTNTYSDATAAFSKGNF